MMTPESATDVAVWLRSLDVDDVAFVQGAAFQVLAMHAGLTEAELYAEWAKRAASDPDANVVRRMYRDGHTEAAE